MSILCAEPTDEGLCRLLLFRDGHDRWTCPSGHVWYGRSTNVLKKTPWRHPIGRRRPPLFRRRFGWSNWTFGFWWMTRREYWVLGIDLGPLELWWRFYR